LIRISEEERREMLKELKEIVKEKPIIPYFKDEGEAVQSLLLGNKDFIAMTKYWRGRFCRISGVYRKIEPWGRATVGFHVRAPSVYDVIDTVNALIEDNKKEELIYFRCDSPDMPTPRTCYVEIGMKVLKETEQDLQRGNVIRREFYDL